MIELFLTFVIFFICLSAHEAAHAFASLKLGDPTAKIEGRLTLNPLAHIDLVGTIIVPIFLIISHLPAFGWAKPVMIDPRNFRNPTRDSFISAIAGPVSNFLFALVGVLAIRLSGLSAGIVFDLLFLLVEINILLGVFNLIPIPPLDGSKVWLLILNPQTYYTLESMGPFLLLAVIVFSYSTSFSIFSWVSSLTNLILGGVI
jgi:Zn-dependent protease